MVMSKQPIGIFDSGVGGTSIWKELHKLLPNESTIYLADSKHGPYGNKSEKKIIALSIKNTEFLLKKGCKLIVVACNTATTNAIQTLREKYSIPFIGIEPAIKPAAFKSKTEVIGVLATKGTLTSKLFSKTMLQFANNIKVVEQVGDGLVPLIESGKIDTLEMKTILQGHLKPLLEANIDCLVLGCSHYPYLIPLLTEMLPKHIQIIDSGEAVAKQTKSILKQNNLTNTEASKPKFLFYSNGNPKTISKLIGKDFKVNYLDF